jgi:ubiquinone/menaquinone biosynthesis C-methylase UbiE
VPQPAGIEEASAAAYDWFSRRLGRRLFGRHLDVALGSASGRVLEVGAGTGGTLPHYPPAVQTVVLTEPDEAMLERARVRAAGEGPPTRCCVCRAEALSFRSGVFDAVVTSLVLCTVADQPQALAEARRTLRPGGALRFLEHVRGAGWLGDAQDLLTPAWRRLAGGCELNRCTEDGIRQAGFAVERIERRPLLGVPLIAGIARRAA